MSCIPHSYVCAMTQFSGFVSFGSAVVPTCVFVCVCVCVCLCMYVCGV